MAGTPSLDASVGALLRTASHNTSLHAMRVFSGPHGLTGVEYENTTSGGKAVAWLTADGQAVIPGDVYDASGTNLTHQAEIEVGLRLAPGSVRAAAVTRSARAIALGTKGPVVTAFFDPNCVYCHALYGSLQPAIAAGKLRVRYVLVGLVRPDSAARAASILASPDPAKALAENEAHFDAVHEEGGFAVAPAAQTDSLQAAIATNNTTMAKAGGVGTPTLVYCSAQTHQFVMQPGALPLATLLTESTDENACTGH